MVYVSLLLIIHKKQYIIKLYYHKVKGNIVSKKIVTCHQKVVTFIKNLFIFFSNFLLFAMYIKNVYISFFWKISRSFTKK